MNKNKQMKLGHSGKLDRIFTSSGRSDKLGRFSLLLVAEVNLGEAEAFGGHVDVVEDVEDLARSVLRVLLHLVRGRRERFRDRTCRRQRYERLQQHLAQKLDGHDAVVVVVVVVTDVDVVVVVEVDVSVVVDVDVDAVVVVVVDVKPEFTMSLTMTVTTVVVGEGKFVISSSKK